MARDITYACIHMFQENSCVRKLSPGFWMDGRVSAEERNCQFVTLDCFFTFCMRPCMRWCVFSHVCTHTHTHTLCTHKLHIHSHARTHGRTHTRKHTHTHACTQTHTYAHTHTHIHAHARARGTKKNLLSETKTSHESGQDAVLWSGLMKF